MVASIRFNVASRTLAVSAGVRWSLSCLGLLMSEEWPYPHQNAAPPDMVHAVGQLIMNWNHAEHGLQTLASEVFEIKGQFPMALLVHVGSGTLVDAIRSVLPFRNLHPGVSRHIDDGLAWFLELRGERNAFAHSIYHPSQSQPGLRRIGASSKGGKLKFREERLDLDKVRALAEEIYDLGAYLQVASRHLDENRELPSNLGTRKFAPRRRTHSQPANPKAGRKERRKRRDQSQE